MLLTADILQAAGGCPRGVALTWAQPLSEACALYEIDAALRLAAFIAETGHESQGFARTVENLNYSAERLLATWPSRFTPASAAAVERNPERIAAIVYGGRMHNYSEGDGFRYRGRGLLMQTGKVNYEAVTELLRERLPSVPDFVAQPGALAEPKWAAYAAAAWWADRGLNALADAGDLLSISRCINLGDKNSRHMPIGWDDRRARYTKARAVLS
jgi:putative chitinase